MSVQKNKDCWYHRVCSYDNCVNCIRYSEVKYLMENSGIPKSKQRPQTLEAGVDYNAFVKLDMIKTNIVNFIGNGNNLYICSNETGNGKTSWSIKLLLKYFDSIWAGNGFKVRGYFQHVPTFLNTLKDFSKSHDALKNTLEDVDIVVWDDIAASKLTDYDINFYKAEPAEFLRLTPSEPFDEETADSCKPPSS